jgi:murein tripeptide amidase MpaA
MNHPRPLLTILLLLVINISLISQEKMWWGNNMPENWNGTWPEELLTAAERSGFTRTADNNDILDYFAMLQWKSEYVHLFSMYTSDRGLTCPVLVMAKPRISSPREAKESGKPVIYLQGGIHTGENEGKEALLILIRDILFGDKEYLLDNLIIMVAPNFNVDGNETRSVNRGLPLLSGIREDARGYDVNRDAIKLETTSMNALCRNIFNSWDPVLIYDTHGRGKSRLPDCLCRIECSGGSSGSA